MNFLFATQSETNNARGNITCNTSPISNASNSAMTAALSPISPIGPSSSSSSSPSQDIELVIEIESSFHGVLLGLPEESAGAVLNATAILHVRKKPIRASKLMVTFDGRIKVQCSDGATFGPEQYRERVLAHKDWVLWEAGSNNTHNTGSGSSKNHIPVGTHYYPLSIQLDGALPPTFSGKYGSIRYIISSTLFRPIFHSDINTVQDIEIKRCLVDQDSQSLSHPIHQTAQPDLGSLLINQLSRAGIMRDGENFDASEPTQGPVLITHHNTHKELLRYTAVSPPIAHLEGGIVQLDLTLEPLPPGSYIYSIAYGIKELIYYRSSPTGNPLGNKSEILYPIGQQTVIIPRDQERERSMSSAGAGASTRQILELRPCPLLTNVDIITPLVEIHHRITCNIVIVRPDSTDSESVNGGGGGGLLKRFNMTSQPTANLRLVDSTGSAVNNNAIFLGEPTRSIIEPAATPVRVELNDFPPSPPSSQLENTILEFPIILTSRYPSASRTLPLMSNPIPFSRGRPVRESTLIREGGEQYNQGSLSFGSQASPSQALLPQQTPILQQFVHNQEISSTCIPTTGTVVHNNDSGVIPVSESPSSSSFSTTPSSGHHHQGFGTNSSSSSQSVTPSLENDNNQSTFVAGQDSLACNEDETRVRAPVQSGISAGLRAAAAAAAAATAGSVAVETERNSTLDIFTSAEFQNMISAPPLSHDELPKYEDVVGGSIEAGLGITIPRSTPMPVPAQVASRRNQSTSPQQQLSSGHRSPSVNHSLNSFTMRNRMFSSPPSSPQHQQDGRIVYNRESQVLSSSPIHSSYRGHARTESATSIMLSTSIPRSQGQGVSMNIQAGNGPSQQQQQLQHQVNLSHGHQRQRSLGTATIIGSLGRNGGYLSQQPTGGVGFSGCAAPTTLGGVGDSMLVNSVLPPAYAMFDV